MSDFDRDERRQLFQVLLAVRPYLGHLTIIGGWVPALYKQYGGLGWEGRVSFTTEVDVLAASSIPVEGGESLENRLRAANFLPKQETGPSATWTQQDANGGEIEFLGPHTGPASTLGETERLLSHGQVGSIRLADLGILANHSNLLRISVTVGSNRTDLEVRLPILGAYLVNKAATYPNRRAYQTGENPKRAKDLLYVRDVIAGGPGVVAQVESDLAVLRVAGMQEQTLIGKARNNLDMTLKGHLYAHAIDAAAGMLAEREGLELVPAKADLIGHLRDALEFLSIVQ
jgi:hypothetical protein